MFHDWIYFNCWQSNSGRRFVYLEGIFRNYSMIVRMKIQSAVILHEFSLLMPPFLLLIHVLSTITNKHELGVFFFTLPSARGMNKDHTIAVRHLRLYRIVLIHPILDWWMVLLLRLTFSLWFLFFSFCLSSSAFALILQNN